MFVFNDMSVRSNSDHGCGMCLYLEVIALKRDACLHWCLSCDTQWGLVNTCPSFYPSEERRGNFGTRDPLTRPAAFFLVNLIRSAVGAELTRLDGEVRRVLVTHSTSFLLQPLLASLQRCQVPVVHFSADSTRLMKIKPLCSWVSLRQWISFLLFKGSLF